MATDATTATAFSFRIIRRLSDLLGKSLRVETLLPEKVPATDIDWLKGVASLLRCETGFRDIYSLFCQNKEGAELLHYEYLAQPKTDPREELIVKLLDEIPEGACVMAHNKTFEIMVLRSLSVWFPEYAERIEALIANMVNLMVPFKNMDVYHYDMNGSYSIKAVLPVLVPELTYEGMEVGDGGMAMDAYARMCRSGDPEEISSIRKALLEYCKLDTMAMVRILEKLKTTGAV